MAAPGLSFVDRERLEQGCLGGLPLLKCEVNPSDGIHCRSPVAALGQFQGPPGRIECRIEAALEEQAFGKVVQSRRGLPQVQRLPVLPLGLLVSPLEHVDTAQDRCGPGQLRVRSRLNGSDGMRLAIGQSAGGNLRFRQIGKDGRNPGIARVQARLEVRESPFQQVDGFDEVSFSVSADTKVVERLIFNRRAGAGPQTKS